MADMVMPELLDSASLIKEMTISLDPYPWEPNFDESVKVNIWCTNGAALIDECHSHRGMPEFRVDTTPPHCFEHVIFISEMDAYPWVQHYDDRLWVDFHAGLDDWQVRLHDVEYKLEDVAPTIEAAGGNTIFEIGKMMDGLDQNGDSKIDLLEFSHAAAVMEEMILNHQVVREEMEKMD